MILVKEGASGALSSGAISSLGSVFESWSSHTNDSESGSCCHFAWHSAGGIGAAKKEG